MGSNIVLVNQQCRDPGTGKNNAYGEDTMKIDAIMTTKIESVGPELTLQEVARKMRDLNIGSLPVMKMGKLVGIITDRDICCRAVGSGLDSKTTKVQDIMSRDISCCYDDQDLDEAAQLMEAKHIRRLAVLKRDNSIAGFLSVDDLARGSHNLAGEVLEACDPTHH